MVSSIGGYFLSGYEATIVHFRNLRERIPMLWPDHSVAAETFGGSQYARGAERRG